jgi:transcriptional regulator with XRE-family HTH domain
MEDPLKVLGNLLYDTRKTKKISQKKMGDILGIAQTTLSQKEHGLHGLTRRQMAVFEENFGINVMDYIREKTGIEDFNCNDEMDIYGDVQNNIEVETLEAEKQLWQSRYQTALAEIKRLEQVIHDFRKSGSKSGSNL